jgi:hypothetical protein
MTVASRTRSAKRIDDIAQLLNQVVDVGANAHHANDIIDEISQLLWTVSSLDPESENLLKHSAYVTGRVTRIPS